MTSRSLAAPLALAVALILAGMASAQEKGAGADSGSSPKDTGSTVKKDRATRAKAQARTRKAKSGGARSRQGQADADATRSASATLTPKTEKATFGGGCFWCMEAVFERVPGVLSVVSGYAGGTVPRPTYDMVCSGLTGHAEVIQVAYDPDKVSYEKLLEVFWTSHDPTTPNTQGPDVGTQYRSIILYHDNAQKEAALKSYRALTAARAFPRPIVTQLVPLKAFYRAEAYHQDYFRKHPDAPYCQAYIVPKVLKMMHR